jgi:hypothetical protein
MAVALVVDELGFPAAHRHGCCCAGGNCFDAAVVATIGGGRSTSCLVKSRKLVDFQKNKGGVVG